MSAPVYSTVKNEEVVPNSSPLAAPSSQSRDISWSNVNFSVGTTRILTDCWGKVSFYDMNAALFC
jgi:hypothetical protein